MGFLRWFIISKTCAYNPKPFPLNPLPSGSDTFYEDCLHSVFHISGLLRKPRASLEAQTVKNLPAMQETLQVLPPGWRSPGEGHGNPLQYSCLENSMDRGAWWTMYGPWGLQRLGHNWGTNTVWVSPPWGAEEGCRVGSWPKVETQPWDCSPHWP